MSWRVALIDSCGRWPGVVESAAFVSEGQQVECRATVEDPSGHGSRIAKLLLSGEASSETGMELLLAQVFLNAEPASGAAVAAAIDWAVAHRANLIHMSLGLGADRAVLRRATAKAIEAGCVVVASTPARGAAVYPASYPGVIRGSGDARCEPGELSCLAPWWFGGCPRGLSEGAVGGDGGSTNAAGGASIGAAWVTRAIASRRKYDTAEAVVAALTAAARYSGPERRGAGGASANY